MAASSQPAPTLQPPNLEQIARPVGADQSGAPEQHPSSQLRQQPASAQYLLTATASLNHEYPLQHHHQSNPISSGRLAAFQPANGELALAGAIPSNTFARYALSQPLAQLELELAQQEQQPAQYAVEGQLLAFAGHQQEHLAPEQQQVLQQQHYMPTTSLTAPTYLAGAEKELQSNFIEQQQQVPRNKPPETGQPSTNQLSGPPQIILVAQGANQLSG